MSPPPGPPGPHFLSNLQEFNKIKHFGLKFLNMFLIGYPYLWTRKHSKRENTAITYERVQGSRFPYIAPIIHLLFDVRLCATFLHLLFRRRAVLLVAMMHAEKSAARAAQSAAETGAPAKLAENSEKQEPAEAAQVPEIDAIIIPPDLPDGPVLFR